MNSNIEDFNQALKESMLNHFGSLDKAIEYGDALEKKNKERQSAFIKKMEDRKKMNKRIKKKTLYPRISKFLLGMQSAKDSTMVRIGAKKSILHTHKANCNYARVRGGFYKMKKKFEYEQELEALYQDWNSTIY